jgi:hypothetical protein
MPADLDFFLKRVPHETEEKESAARSRAEVSLREIIRGKAAALTETASLPRALI